MKQPLLKGVPWTLGIVVVNVLYIYMIQTRLSITHYIKYIFIYNNIIHIIYNVQVSKVATVHLAHFLYLFAFVWTHVGALLQ